MPLDISHEYFLFNGTFIPYTLVSMNGITHALIKTENSTNKQLAAALMQQLKTDKSDCALGVNIWTENPYSILSLVYVRETNTEIWEHGCGSASLALVSYLSWVNKKTISINILQSSRKNIKAVAHYELDKIEKFEIATEADVISKGQVYVTEEIADMNRIEQKVPRPARMFRFMDWRKQNIVLPVLWRKNGKKN